MKKLLYIILGLGVLYIILCLFGPSMAKVERSTTINAPAELIKTKLTDLRLFHDSWSPWTEKDPNMKTTYNGEAGKPGSSMSWESQDKHVGKGTMTYLATSGDTVLQSLHFEGMGDARVYFVVNPDGTASKVTWGMTNPIGFFGRGFMLFMNIDKMVGPDFEKGLSKLKPLMEGMSSNNSDPMAVHYDIKELNWEGKTYVGKKATLGFDQLSAFFAENYPKLYADVKKDKVEAESHPSAIYFKYDEANKQTECAAVVAVKNGKEMKSWEKFNLPASKVLHIEYYGAYDKSAPAHAAMDAYMKEKGLTQNWVVEEYVTDPMTEKDTAKWLTNIFYVLK